MDSDYEAPDTEDMAAEAFSRLEGEIAVMRRAVQQLATEKANIDIPDYSATLGEMADSLATVADTMITIAAKPAMTMTPETMAQRIDQAARSTRQSYTERITAAENRYDHAVRDLTKVVASARSAGDQRERMIWSAGGGVLAGCLLWAIMPGAIARTLPASWHLPEKIAARTLGEASVWDAGARLIRVGSPDAWRAISSAADMRHANREKIAACEAAARKAKDSVRCTIKVDVPR